MTPVPPFRLDLTVWALRRRPDNVIDRWDGRVYRRVLAVGSGAVEIAVEQTGPPDRPKIDVGLAGGTGRPGVERIARDAVEHLLGIRTELSDFYRVARRDPRLASLAQRHRGVKPPRFPTLFEALANAIACQQLSLTVGILLLNRLAGACGPALRRDGRAFHAFPRPEDVAAVRPGTLRDLGWSRQKILALLTLARGIVDKRIDLEGLEERDDAAAAARLLAIRGIGRWSAEYVLLRGLGRLHVFPGDDAGARNSVERWFRPDDRLDYEGVRRLVGRWHPYAGFVYFHFLLEGLVGAPAGMASPLVPRRVSR